MASDFDEIFGDLKEDQHATPSLTADFDDDSIFGDPAPRDTSKSSVEKTQTAPTPVPSAPPDIAPTATGDDGAQGAQDDFLSWLDDTPKPSAPAPTPSPFSATMPPPPIQVEHSSGAVTDSFSVDDDDEHASAPVAPMPAQAIIESPKKQETMPAPMESIPLETVVMEPVPFDDISLDSVSVEGDAPVEPARVASSVPIDLSPTGAAEFDTVSLDDPIPTVVHTIDEAHECVAAPQMIATPSVDQKMLEAAAAAASAEISLDDDDDDDFLEKIVQNANRKQQASSREASSSSLAIKSQSHSHTHESIDAPALLRAYLETGTVPTASRVSLWKHCMQIPVTGESLSMYALQTTSLDLPSQAILRKEVESLCAAIFTSSIHRESIEAAAESDEMDGAHLLFLDNAEILITHLCKSLRVDYSPGLVLIFAPLLAAGGSDPLRLELVDVLRGVCTRLLPHLSRPTTGSHEEPSSARLSSIANARRALLKPLLLYHSPTLARHLEQHFPSWPNAVRRDQHIEDCGAIPDTWLGSFFESERHSTDFDYLLKVWDGYLLLDTALGSSPHQHIGSLIVIHLLMRAEKSLMRMEGEQLHHCLTSTLIEMLQDKSDTLVSGVKCLVQTTPPSFLARICDAVNGMIEPVSEVADSKSPVPTPSSSGLNGLNAMSSLLTASANGVKELSSAMIDMPSKLLTIVPMKPLTLGLIKIEDAIPGQSAQELFFLHAQALAVLPRAIAFTTEDVIPHVFRSFQSSPLPPSSPKLRFFVIDCRAEPEDGHIPTAFRLDPDNEDPATMEQLTTLKHSAHFAVMGSGFTQVALELRQLQETQYQEYQQLQHIQFGDKKALFAFNEAFLEALARDQRRIHAVVELLTSRGFSKVSVLDGGFASTHSLLRRSSEFSTADLVDHDATHCAMCAHSERIAVLQDAARTKSGKTESLGEKQVSERIGGSSTLGSSIDDRSGSSRSSSAAKIARTASGGLDAKALFDSHASTSSPSPKYLSSFAGALKTGGKTLMNPADSLKESTKWLMKKSASGETATSSPNGANATSPTTGSPGVALGIGGLSKLRNSLAHIGSESIDMIRKAEQAATAKTRLSFSTPPTHPTAAKPTTHASRPSSTTSPGVAVARGVPVPSSSVDRGQPSEEEVFTIDDDEEEEQDDFVGGSDARTASLSPSGTRNGSFQGEASAADSTFVLHSVVKDHVSDLRKGMRVSRTQMLPCVESPFFSGYKKKRVTAPGGQTAEPKIVMLPRRLVLMENHLVVLKAERNADDVYLVKSCHPLAHLARMTCLKKNALMVTIYYKWQLEGRADCTEKRNAYEVQQRDEFIRAIKSAMDKM